MEWLDHLCRIFLIEGLNKRVMVLVFVLGFCIFRILLLYGVSQCQEKKKDKKKEKYVKGFFCIVRIWLKFWNKIR